LPSVAASCRGCSSPSRRRLAVAHRLGNDSSGRFLPTMATTCVSLLHHAPSHPLSRVMSGDARPRLGRSEAAPIARRAAEQATLGLTARLPRAAATVGRHHRPRLSVSRLAQPWRRTRSTAHSIVISPRQRWRWQSPSAESTSSTMTPSTRRHCGVRVRRAWPRQRRAVTVRWARARHRQHSGVPVTRRSWSCSRWACCRRLMGGDAQLQGHAPTGQGRD